ncbi:Peptidyl-prolyl cis-trans isomerase, chloroplastic [Galdieria sulphuraria]|uniref:peptidylprolyl isomerase n=1 Tax=Galdieria sulphuraria TaxID=130081 RepID=M2VYB7_GALSU|nr:peptidylprolyl isomerase [Galdieria sulphuraria]EME28286.1 peptidylprolyl isomerase [Galdieria sulphuraria]GJD08889.1 Peptidyl-prolyl cis-trans isomerase, chloroplastic [Galdieria sulphuraria]|eukprot:XP_005704806.1 peptidylprolyl isomerase [Galdieria sulphuraria]
MGLDKDSWQVQASVISDNTLLRRYIVTNGKAILRYALPIPIDEPIRVLQSTLEQLLIDLHSPGKSGLSLAWKDIQKAVQILHKSEVEILLDSRKEHRDEAASALGDIDQLLGIIRDKIQIAKNSKKAVKDMKNDIANETETSLDKIAQLEEWMVQGFPYPIPHKYDSLPRLKGRATVEMTITKANVALNSSPFRDKNGSPIGNSIHLVIVLDGYSAPLTSGNFMQVLLNNLYQDATVVDKDSGFYLLIQPKQLFIDPDTQKPRNIPMEVLIDGDPYPIWGKTLETADLADLQPVLPMTAFGAIAMVHSSEDENDANSSFFIFTLDPRSEQARNKGGNILNGNVATFGYIVQGLEYLPQISPKDKITYTRILNGIDKWEKEGAF